MGFASAWLDKRALFPAIIKEAPDTDTGIIVVVPAYNEPGIHSLLDSLKVCTEPDCKAEVIIVVNAPADASAGSLEINRNCLKNIESWKEANNSFFRLYGFDMGDHKIKEWGVGLSRKCGMDEALRRFDSIGREDGVIVCLDADCTVEKNYFAVLSDELLATKERKACSIYFEHPLSGTEFHDHIYRNIILYELHLRYITEGLVYSGFPYAFHTVGSAMACKAVNYVKAGGMNRKQAGEDFYFIQKLVPQGGYFTLNKTAVFPSPRESFRVPFGTGATMSKLISDNSDMLFTYNTRAYSDLQRLFYNIPELFDADSKNLRSFYSELSDGLRSFIDPGEWLEKIDEIRGNTSGKASFRKRFFTWFNMFKIVRYLNHVHAEIFEKQPVPVSARELLSLCSKDFGSDDPLQLLLFFRQLEKRKSVILT